MKFSSRLFLLLLILCFPLACSKTEPPSELDRAAGAIRSMLAPKNLSKSMFAAGFPDGKPSQYVSFLFSDMGVAEWPTAVDEMEEKQMKSGMVKVLPAGVALVPLTPKADVKQQLVVKFDDAKGVIILEGYLDPKQPPVLVSEVPLRSVRADPYSAEFYRSNKQMGMSDQAF